MASYRRRRRYNRYRDYYDDEYEVENPIAGLVMIGLVYFVYKYYSDRATFWRWVSYGGVLLAILVAVLIAIIVWKRKKAEKIAAESQSVNADIVSMIEESGKDKAVIEKTEIKNSPTPQAIALRDALIARGIKCELEKDDGHKHVDIAITWARLNIEIDGMQHYLDPAQMKSDLQRNYYSVRKGYKTIRYPNYVIEKHLDSVADAIAKIARGEYYKRIY